MIVLITVAALMAVIAYSLTISLNSTDYYDYISKSNYKLSNRRLAELMNGNAMSNIPNINLNTKDPTTCETSAAIFLTKLPENLVHQDEYELSNESIDVTYDRDCEKICPNRSLQSLVIRDPAKQEIYSMNKKLYTGIWCVSKRPRCNLRTTYAIITMNSNVMCRSRYPNFFAGPEGNKIIACNNSVYYHAKNELWDELKGEPVDPKTINMTHEDEPLPGKSGVKMKKEDYRFQCHFNGTDLMGNKFVAHPLNRLHPIRNPCTLEIPGATDSRYQFIEEDGKCLCNVDRETIGNRFLGNEQSPCTSCRTFWKDTTDLVVHEPCFPSGAVYSEARHKLPCFTGLAGGTEVPCNEIETVVMKVHNPAVVDNQITLPLFPNRSTIYGTIQGGWVTHNIFGLGPYYNKLTAAEMAGLQAAFSLSPDYLFTIQNQFKDED